jgi:ketosteroid isomerase-like protein
VDSARSPAADRRRPDRRALAAAEFKFRQFERNLAAAYLRGDRAFVDNLLADDWTFTDYRGRTWTKPDVLALFDGPRPLTKSEIDVDRVRLAGDVAIVAGQSVAEGVKRDGRWRIVASQGTEIQ